jgi:MoxR-like ATPase
MSSSPPVGQAIRALSEDLQAVRRELGKRIVGQEPVVDGALTALLAGGHLLLEGPPGLGKTALVLALAEVLGLAWHRVQFTADLMPADVVGTYVVMENAQGRRTFEFHQGPLFANLLLADHINRGMPKTQSALLEALESQTVSVSSEQFALPQPFFVLATQNPLEMEATFPLPEPQLDRFFFKLRVGRPDDAQLDAILQRTTESEPAPLRAIIDGRRILEMRSLVQTLPVPAVVRRYAVAIVQATQPGDRRATPSVARFVRYGVSPRAAQALVTGAKIHALLNGREEATVADLREIAPAALGHRLILNFEGQAENLDPDRLVEEVLQAVPA